MQTPTENLFRAGLRLRHLLDVAMLALVPTDHVQGAQTPAEVQRRCYPSVQVLTEEFIRDFKLFDLDEQVPFISGMAAGDPSAGGGGGTRVRGFIVPYFRRWARPEFCSGGAAEMR